MFSLDGLSRKISSIADDVRAVINAETGMRYEAALVEQAMRQVVEERMDALEEGLLEIFTVPGRDEFQQLASILERKAAEQQAGAIVEKAALAQEHGDESVFTGRRAFSKQKLAGMIEYLTSKGGHVYKTSLNKLLFYSDLTAFYLRRQGISGAAYYNRPYGPVADPASSLLVELVAEGKVNILPRTQTLEAAASPDAAVLTDDERRILDWVLASYGSMSAREVSEYSHREMAYKYTEANEPIAYAYAQFFHKLPPKDLLN
jgi:uncharacterized phage-associated protein